MPELCVLALTLRTLSDGVMQIHHPRCGGEVIFLGRFFLMLLPELLRRRKVTYFVDFLLYNTRKACRGARKSWMTRHCTIVRVQFYCLGWLSLMSGRQVGAIVWFVIGVWCCCMFITRGLSVLTYRWQSNLKTLGNLNSTWFFSPPPPPCRVVFLFFTFCKTRWIDRVGTKRWAANRSLDRKKTGSFLSTWLCDHSPRQLKGNIRRQYT